MVKKITHCIVPIISVISLNSIFLIDVRFSIKFVSKQDILFYSFSIFLFGDTDLSVVSISIALLVPLSHMA